MLGMFILSQSLTQTNIYKLKYENNLFTTDKASEKKK